MTPRDIVEWNFGISSLLSTKEELVQDIQDAIAEAVAAERETCANIAMEIQGPSGVTIDTNPPILPIGWRIAAAIRARGDRIE